MVQGATNKVHVMSANESPYGPSPMAVEAVKRAVGSTNYYPPRTDIQLTRALAEHFGCGLLPGNFIAANGAVDVIRLIEDSYFKAGRGNSVVVCPPCFAPYSRMAQVKGARVIECPLDAANSFAVSAKAIRKAVRWDTRLVYVCNPNNPTGTWFGKEQLNQILDCLPPKTMLVYDSVYYQFANEFDLPSGLDCVLKDRNIIVLHSFSKAYGMAGMRLGYGIAREAIIKKLRRNSLPFQTSSVGLAAMIAGLKDTKFIEQVVAGNAEQRRWLQGQLDNLGIEYWPSQANFICFRVPFGKAAECLVERLAYFGILVRTAFYLPQHVRVTVGVPEANQQFICILQDILREFERESAKWKK